VTAKTAVDCEDILVLALYSQLARRSPARRHNAAILSVHPDVPLELRAHIRSLYEQAKKTIWHRDQTPQGLLKETTVLFAEVWEASRELLGNLEGVYGARKALRWSDLPSCKHYFLIIFSGASMHIVFCKRLGRLSH
jgi:hypothetical protein